MLNICSNICFVFEGKSGQPSTRTGSQNLNQKSKNKSKVEPLIFGYHAQRKTYTIFDNYDVHQGWCTMQRLISAVTKVWPYILGLSALVSLISGWDIAMQKLDAVRNGVTTLPMAVLDWL